MINFIVGTYLVESFIMDLLHFHSYFLSGATTSFSDIYKGLLLFLHFSCMRKAYLIDLIEFVVVVVAAVGFITFCSFL